MEDQKRHSRFSRSESHQPVRVQERDLAILQALYSYRLLTTTQLSDLFFPTKIRALQRLRQLYDAELIERIYRPVTTGSAEILYILDTEGINFLTQQTDLDREEISAQRARAKSLKPFFLDHFIEVNQFRISITLSAEQHGLTLLFWKYDHELQNKNDQGVLISDRVVDPENPQQRIPITPDGFFGIETPKGNAYFFIEVDRGTMTNPRFQTKMRGYARYFIDGVFTEKWGYKAFRVLTSTTTNRVPNLLNNTNQLSDKQLLPIFHFTAQENITPERILAPIWSTPNGGEPKGIV